MIVFSPLFSGKQIVYFLRRIVICGLSGSKYVSYTLFHKRHLFRERIIEYKMRVFLFSLQILSEIFLILRRIQGGVYINNCPTRCNTKRSIYYCASSLYMFRVSTTPIIRSTQNCHYSLRCWSCFFVQLPLSNAAKLEMHKKYDQYRRL